MAFIYFTCQGHLFFQAGEEFGRTKFGDHNSYRSSPEINMLRWKQAVIFRELVDYYRGLIALRKCLPGLYDKSPTAGSRISGETVHREGVVSFFVDNEGEKKEWDKLYIVYNASDQLFTVEPNGERWEVLVDGKKADFRKKAARQVTVAAHSGLLMGRRNSEETQAAGSGEKFRGNLETCPE